MNVSARRIEPIVMPDACSICVANFAMAKQRSSTVLPISPDKFGLNGRGEQVDARGTPVNPVFSKTTQRHEAERLAPAAPRQLVLAP